MGGADNTGKGDMLMMPDTLCGPETATPMVLRNYLPEILF